jgi:YVTN family beta-propeller protein
VIDTATNDVLEDSAIAVGFSPSDIAVSPDGTFAYVTHRSDTAVSVVNLATGAVLEETIQVDFDPYRVIFSPDGSHAFVSSTSGSVAVIDTTDHSVEATIPITNTASGLGIYGDHLYVGNQEFPNSQLTVIDLADNNAEVDEIILVEDNHLVPQMMAVVGNRGYVPLPGAGVVHVINLDTNEIVDTNSVLAGVNPIPLAEGDFPTGVAAHGDRVYVVGAFSQTLTVIDTNTNTVVEVVPLPFTPTSGVAVSQDGSEIYVMAADYSNPEDYDGAVIVLTSARSSSV